MKLSITKWSSNYKDILQYQHKMLDLKSTWCHKVDIYIDLNTVAHRNQIFALIFSFLSTKMADVNQWLPKTTANLSTLHQVI